MAISLQATRGIRISPIPPLQKRYGDIRQVTLQSHPAKSQLLPASRTALLMGVAEHAGFR